MEKKRTEAYGVFLTSNVKLFVTCSVLFSYCVQSCFSERTLLLYGSYAFVMGVRLVLGSVRFFFHGHTLLFYGRTIRFE